MTLGLLEDLGLSTKSHLNVLNAHVIIYGIPSKVGVHAGLPIVKVFGLTGAIKEWDIDVHTFQYVSPMVLMSPIPIVMSVGAVAVTKVVARRTRVTRVIVVTIITSVLGCERVVIAIVRLTVDSLIEFISSARVTLMSWIVSLVLTLVATVGSMLVIVWSWGHQTGWIIQTSRETCLLWS